jgi:hypothetical protein
VKPNVDTSLIDAAGTKAQTAKTEFLRKAAARTADAVCDAVGGILKMVTPQEWRNYFARAG